jgi:hypothetical protein
MNLPSDESLFKERWVLTSNVWFLQQVFADHCRWEATGSVALHLGDPTLDALQSDSISRVGWSLLGSERNGSAVACKPRWNDDTR